MSGGQASSSAVPPRLLVAVGIFGRSNEPLYFKSFGGGADDALRLQAAAFASLDVVEEKVALGRRRAGAGAAGAAGGSAGAASAGGGGGGGALDPFLGLLLPVEEHKVFGFAAATGVKIVLVLRDVLLREDRLREAFRGVARLLADAAAAPFANPDAPCASPAFEAALTRLLDAANASIAYTGAPPL